MTRALLLNTVDRFFSTEAPTRPGDTVLVAFSGGPDSTALLWSLAELASKRAWRIHAAHLDHGLDTGSTERARAAEAIASRLELPITMAREEVRSIRRSGESLESAARRVRYRFLRQTAAELGAVYIATAHQRNDQIETVLLRILSGTGLRGLAAIPPRREQIVRPLLTLDRTVLTATLARAGVSYIEDPTNAELDATRNRVRHLLIPHLQSEYPDLVPLGTALAAAAAGAAKRLDQIVQQTIHSRQTDEGAEADLTRFRALPDPLQSFALGQIHRLAGLTYPPGLRATAELKRQLDEQGRATCDAGGGWRWETRGDALQLRQTKAPSNDFAYTLEVPGAISIPELDLRIAVSVGPVAPWMFRGSPSRTGLAVPPGSDSLVTVRNRRPGDWIQPLGCPYRRRLKDVLIDRKIPRDARSRIPLLCVGDRIAWVPGITIDDSFRVREGETIWRAEILYR